MMANIGRHEKALRFGAYKHVLRPRRGLAPHRHTPINAVPHGEDFASHFECRVTHTALLASLREGKADRSQLVQYILFHSGNSTSRYTRSLACRRISRNWSICI